MPIRLKSKVYKTVIRPAALHGSEYGYWPTTVKHEKIQCYGDAYAPLVLGLTPMFPLSCARVRAHRALKVCAHEKSERAHAYRMKQCKILLSALLCTTLK